MAFEPRYPVGRTLLGATVSLVVGLSAFALAYSETKKVIVAISSRAHVVALWAAVMGGFPIAAGMAFIVTLSLLSLRRDGAEPVLKPLMGIAFAFFALTFVMPPVVATIITGRLTRDGYVRCPAIYERPITRVRWARPATACPVGRR